jgi:hypothetical protein
MVKDIAQLPWTPFVKAEDCPEIGDDLIVLNSRYQVNVRYLGERPVFGKVVHLSIKRRDKKPLRSWRELQRIKNEICGEGCEAVEIFPAESRLVDSSNQYHVYVFESYRLPFGFEDRFVSEQATHGAVQEPFEDGWKPADCGARDEEAALIMEAVHMRIAARRALEVAGK